MFFQSIKGVSFSALNCLCSTDCLQSGEILTVTTNQSESVGHIAMWKPNIDVNCINAVIIGRIWPVFCTLSHTVLNQLSHHDIRA